MLILYMGLMRLGWWTRVRREQKWQGARVVHAKLGSEVRRDKRNKRTFLLWLYNLGRPSLGKILMMLMMAVVVAVRF